MSRKLFQIVLSIALIGGSLTYLLSESLSDEIEYFHPVDVVLHQKSELSGKKFRMGGYVVKDSIFHKKGTLEYQFSVRPVPGMMKFGQYAEQSLTVRYTGIVPDTFKDDAEVIVSGTLGGDGVFLASDLLAKCPSKYEAAEKNEGKY